MSDLSQSGKLVATDEGTHGQPKTVKVYQRRDGTRYSIIYIAGVSHSYREGVVESFHGRLRWFTKEGQ